MPGSFDMVRKHVYFLALVFGTLGGILVIGDARAAPDAAAVKQAPSGAAYRYVDNGSPAFVDDLALVPREHRDSVEIVIGPGVPEIYQYRTRRGRMAYTNDRFRIPAKQRDKAKVVDLSQISLNSELAADLSRAIDVQYEAVIDSDLCRNTRDAADASWLAVTWQEHGELMFLGGVILLLFMVTPIALQHLDVQIWAKLLSLSVMACGFLGLMLFLIGEATNHKEQLVSMAAPCYHDGESSSAGSMTTARSRANAIQTMQRRIAERKAALDAVMNQ